MGVLLLTWFTVVLFAMLVFWGVNVPASRRSVGVAWIVAVIVVFNIVAQTYFFRNDVGLTSSAQARQAAEQGDVAFQAFLSKIAMTSDGLRGAPIKDWYKLLSSSLIHYGWLHLLYNLWFFVLFAHVIEVTWGFKKLALIASAGFLIPPALDGLVAFPGVQMANHTGGLSGVVYAMMGACLVGFPRARCYVAINYDLRYWAAVFFIILPVTMITRYAGLALTEMVIVCGMLGSFLLIQPEHFRISIPIIIVMLYKLLQDVLLVQPVCGDIISNSLWRILGGFVIGVAGGFVFSGIRGWSVTWDDETRIAKLNPNSRKRVPLAQLENAAQNDPDAARTFLGQRVFIGDAARAAQFYREVVMTKFPDLALPMQEQMALARLLQFKGLEPAALHAYEVLLRMEPLHEEYWIAWLKAAELITKVDPKRSADARKYLIKFKQGTNILMRDQIEAERLLEGLPAFSLQAEREEEADNLEFNSTVDHEANRPIEILSYTAAAENSVPLETETGLTLPSRKRPRKRQSASVLDMPRRTPLSFRYVAGEVPVSIERHSSRREIKADNADSETLLSHWKPMPCIAERKIPEAAIVELSLKSRGSTEQTDKPGMYGDMSDNSKETSTKSGGRLSRLELMRVDMKAHIPEKSSARSQYGGLDEHDFSSEPERRRFRLRGEKGEPQSRRQPPRRWDKSAPSADLPGKPRLSPTDKMPPADEGYGAAPSNN